MKIVIVDGQGGSIGSALVSRLLTKYPYADIIAIGTNSIATKTMKKAGAEQVATGENPVKVACRTADIIMGPIGIIAADSLLGEITPGISEAITESSAQKILIPIEKCHIMVAGITKKTISEYIDMAVEKISEIKL